MPKKKMGDEDFDDPMGQREEKTLADEIREDEESRRFLGEGGEDKLAIPEKHFPMDALKKGVVPGAEEEEPEDFVIPRLRLLQSVSTEVEDGTSKVGVIMHSVSGEEWENGLEFIPICLRKTRILFDQDNLKGAPLCFAPDGKRNREGFLCLRECPFDDAHLWKNSQPPRCARGMNFPCLILKDGKLTGDFASATFAKSSTQAGQKLVYCRKISGLPYWAFVYKLYSQKRKFQKGLAYIFEVTQIRKTTLDEQRIAEHIYESIGKKLVEEEEVTEA